MWPLPETAMKVLCNCLVGTLSYGMVYTGGGGNGTVNISIISI